MPKGAGSTKKKSFLRVKESELKGCWDCSKAIELECYLNAPMKTWVSFRSGFLNFKRYLRYGSCQTWHYAPQTS
jgi:hypothetical protein